MGALVTPIMPPGAPAGPLEWGARPMLNNRAAIVASVLGVGCPGGCERRCGGGGMAREALGGGASVLGVSRAADAAAGLAEWACCSTRSCAHSDSFSSLLMRLYLQCTHVCMCVCVP
eukprot:1159892-Pelagomonas_calceolata.AAC.2